MPLVRFAARALADIDRIFDFLAGHDSEVAGKAAEAIVDATAVLQRRPMIGRAIEGSLRELVISWGSTGFVALYRFLPGADRVEILAIRHQHEAGFS
ncbi:MAG: type II toxin-antitoxin system RelE/ParE family toxin [Myxococcaceae bacterium]